ncbi:MAG: DUF6440 family protein [Oscillospiraceae bacterium]|nr:DUF6440 family protein [Oscillospiraceae bacterium]
MGKKKETRFEIILEEKIDIMSTNRILRDKETGVSYFLHICGYGGGLTPLLDREGKPLTDRAEKPDASDDGELKRLTEKIEIHLSEIRLLNNHIEDTAVSGELSGIEKTMCAIRTQLKEETKIIKKTSELTQFFDYYVPAIIKILNSYRRIETHELTGENATETKKQVCEILPFINRAFEKELDFMFTDEMLDVTTDIKVLESMLSKDGLIDKNKG